MIHKAAKTLLSLILATTPAPVCSEAVLDAAEIKPIDNVVHSEITTYVKEHGTVNHTFTENSKAINKYQYYVDGTNIKIEVIETSYTLADISSVTPQIVLSPPLLTTIYVGRNVLTDINSNEIFDKEDLLILYQLKGPHQLSFMTQNDSQAQDYFTGIYDVAKMYLKPVSEEPIYDRGTSGKGGIAIVRNYITLPYKL